MRVRTPRKALVFTIALAVTLGACASGGGGSARAPGSSSTRIVRAELEPLGQVNALQAIERLRPRWTQSRSGEQPVLYVDGARRSSLNDLSTMRIGDVAQMEYMSAGDATTRYGTGHGGGAIMVTSVR
jgi:hypothetical protein